MPQVEKDRSILDQAVPEEVGRFMSEQNIPTVLYCTGCQAVIWPLPGTPKGSTLKINELEYLAGIHASRGSNHEVQCFRRMPKAN